MNDAQADLRETINKTTHKRFPHPSLHSYTVHTSHNQIWGTPAPATMLYEPATERNFVHINSVILLLGSRNALLYLRRLTEM